MLLLVTNSLTVLDRFFPNNFASNLNQLADAIYSTFIMSFIIFAIYFVGQYIIFYKLKRRILFAHLGLISIFYISTYVLTIIVIIIFHYKWIPIITNNKLSNISEQSEYLFSTLSIISLAVCAFLSFLIISYNVFLMIKTLQSVSKISLFREQEDYDFNRVINQEKQKTNIKLSDIKLLSPIYSEDTDLTKTIEENPNITKTLHLKNKLLVKKIKKSIIKDSWIYKSDGKVKKHYLKDIDDDI